MKTQEIVSLQDLKSRLSPDGRTYLLLYKSGSPNSECALNNLEHTRSDEDYVILTADVQTVRDIHPAFQVNSVPSMLEFDRGVFRNIYKGCQDPAVMKALFEEAVYVAKMKKEGKEIKSVTVYSTPTCTWCTTLKNYLNKNKIRYTDVDISRDQSAAQNLVARTGQQGVPQTEINGQWVVGFDQKKLDTLLEIK